MKTLSRAALALLAALAGAVGTAPRAAAGEAAASPLPAKSLRFEIVRNGDDIGYATVDVQREGDRTIVETETRMRVKVLFFTAFRFEHTTREVWHDGQLVRLETSTYDDGAEFAVTAARNGDGLDVSGPKGDYSAPAGVLPTTYWNPATRDQSKLLNTRKGDVIDVEIVDKGTVDSADAVAPRGAKHFLIDGPKTDFNVFYCGVSQTWCGLQFETRGSDIAYRPLFDAETLIAEEAGQASEDR